ncbi:DUF2796 domain-containing protein [uncultured Methylophaga sp.]|uniref:ZrgA family zinc uptake protein n=1 Tax=uncultured Methylophaga sp. TaxID=285271 RepID=UPI002602EDE3|nr:DUF2796 domain-containing protein [uncultured Methylophaga sp.]
MNRFRLNALGSVIAALLSVSTSAAVVADEQHDHHDHHGHQHSSTEAHVHGEAALNLVIDGQTLLVEFISPMENLLGFEHAPKTEQQKQSYQQLLRQLAGYRSLFSIPGGQCQLTDQHHKPPFNDASGKHAEWQGEYHLSCDELEQADRLQPEIFSAFPGVEKLTVQLISTKGQSQFILSKDSDPVPLR